MQVQDVELIKVEADTGNELSDNFYRVCVFCDKVVRVSPQFFKSCAQLSGNKFFCPFCLRNDHNHRDSRHILLMSYRAIIGYLYYVHYDGKSPRDIYFSQIERYIEKHQNVGLSNPVFSYDPHTFLWFVDFNKVGSAKNKAPFEEVKHTIKLMLDAFELKNNYHEKMYDEMLDKFIKAATTFYEQRKRPKNRRMLIPTIEDHQLDKKFLEQTRDFTRNLFYLRQS